MLPVFFILTLHPFCFYRKGFFFHVHLFARFLPGVQNLWLQLEINSCRRTITISALVVSGRQYRRQYQPLKGFDSTTLIMESELGVSTRLQRFLAVLESIREMVMDGECLQETDVALLERAKNDIVTSAVDILQRTRNEIAERKRHLIAAKRTGEKTGAGHSNEYEAEEETEPRRRKKSWPNTMKKNENYEVAVELLKWILIFTRNSESESTFMNAFLRKGFAGYGAFRYEIRNITRIVCKHLYPHDDDQAQAMLDRFEKKDGWLDSFVMDMKTYFWETVKPRMPTEKWNEMVSPDYEAHTIYLFLEWSRLLKICRNTGS